MSAPGVALAAERAAPLTVSGTGAAWLALLRDLTLAFRKPRPAGAAARLLRHRDDCCSRSPSRRSSSRLREVAPGVLWTAALLSSLLALEFLFRDDAYDGTLEQYALSGQSLTWLLFAKTAAHWLLTGLPLALMAPLAALSLGAPAAAVAGYRGLGRRGQRRPQPDRLDRRGADAGHEALRARCCRC